MSAHARTHARCRRPHPHSCVPPRLEACAEVRLRPGRHGDGAGLLDLDVRQGQGQRRGAADNLAVLVVLGAVARADELVRGPDPRHDAAQVRAHGVDAKVLDAVLGGDEVGGFAPEPLHELTVVWLVGFDPIGDLDRVPVDVAGQRRATAATARLGDEVPEVAPEEDEHGHRRGGHRDEVHQHAALHVRHEARVLAGGLHGHRGMRPGSGRADAGRHEGAGEEAAAGRDHQQPGGQRAAGRAPARGCARPAGHGCAEEKGTDV
mmetsp:Transcript_89274/g.277603  ORF Transcript_89274/g.277603 Transcript_89274/m.277603 type:complete len:263 (+) Transcript_89274:164-952(+)